MKKITLPILFLSLLISSFSSLADHGHQEQLSNGLSYGEQVGDKALKGFANMTTAVLEIPKNIINTTNQSDVVRGTIGGLAKGIVHTVGRMMTGLADFVTAPLVTKPIAQPEYIWDDFDLDTTYGDTFRLKKDPQH